MNDGMYIAFRSYLEEHSSLLRQLLEEQKRTNEMLARYTANVFPGATAADISPAEIAAATTPKAATKKGK